MPKNQIEISKTLGRINSIAPAGYALGFHIDFNAPRFMFQTYPKAWLDHYSNKGLIISDPMVPWGFQNTGSCRWSDLDDRAGVFEQATDFGLPFGLVISEGPMDSRSICGFAHAEREFTEQETAELIALVKEVHESTAETAQLDAATVEQLKRMSIMVTHPGS